MRYPFAGEHARCGVVRIGEKSSHHAPREEGDRAPRSIAARACTRRFRPIVSLLASMAAANPARPGNRAKSPAMPNAAHHTRESERQREQPRTREHAQDEAPYARDAPAAARVHRGARRLEQRTIRNAGGADGLTGAATQALIDVRSQRRVVRGDVTLQQRAHENETAARRVILVAQGQICRTGLHAEAAVHACVQPGRGLSKRRIGNGAARRSDDGHR